MKLLQFKKEDFILFFLFINIIKMKMKNCRFIPINEAETSFKKTKLNQNQLDIDKNIQNMIELGLKTGKIKRSRYIPVKCYESDDDFVLDWDSISQEETKFIYVVENDEIDNMLKDKGINVFEKK